MRRYLIIIIVVSLVGVILMPSFNVLAAVPTVLTYNADASGIDAVLNGNITATGDGDDDERGFVWDTTTHADPGNTAPGASAYSDSWTESDSFGTGDFNHEITGLTALVTYYYRACAHSLDGWAYGDEVTFFTLVDGKVYLEFRPDLSESRITGNAAVPSKPADILVEGMFVGYVMPLFADDDQELFFIHCVPDRWDDSRDPVYGSHILVHIVSSLSTADESTRGYRLELAWDNVTPNEEEIPAPGVLHPNIVEAARMVYSDTQYECYRDWFVILCNVGDGIEIDDLIALRIRRILHTDDQKSDNELIGDLIIHRVDILYARGDFLGDPEGGITTIINNLIVGGVLIGGVEVLLLAFIVFALGLTISAFALKQQMLAFAGAGGWLFLGIYALSLSTAPLDLYWSIMFFSMFMIVVMSFAGVGIRRRDKSVEEEIGAEEEEKSEGDSDYEDYEKQQGRAMNPVKRVRNALRGRKKKTKLSRAEKHYLLTGEEKPLTGDLKRRVNEKRKRR